MEQDLILLLESKVDGLIQRINELTEENRTLKEELEAKKNALDEAKSRIDDLEGKKQAALEKIRSILAKIEGMDTTGGSGPGVDVGGAPAPDGITDQEADREGGGSTLF